MTDAVPRSVLIVGASAAGLSVATGLRSRGYPGAITLIGAETESPYDRPPLTKQLLAGSWARDRADLLPRERLEALRAEFHMGRRAVALDVGSRVVRTDEGAEHPYDSLVVATGVRPRTFPGWDVEGVQVLRTMDDCCALRRALRPGTRLAVVGAGFLGLEAAATASQLGAEVTVIEPLSDPLASRIGPRAAARLLELHAEHGVEIVTGTSVKGVTVSDDGSSSALKAVELADGSFVSADVVLVAIGCIPCTDWLADSGLDVVDGVLCDEYCSPGPGLWAAGDVARSFRPVLGQHLRIEHRTNASEQGDAVAANILGAGSPFDPVPFFWTDHYDVKIQVAGLLPSELESEVVEDDPATGAFVELFYDGDRLAGVVGWNSMRAMMPYRRTLGEQHLVALESSRRNQTA
jgi:NADPH-dependent 2,4-dienoyl-CoA reductase/sulfur reductase-like enzyme